MILVVAMKKHLPQAEINLILFVKSRIIKTENSNQKEAIAPMTETELLTLIRGGENIRVEFKKSTNDVTKDVYDTVCSFSNREGGIIVLGVKDNGEVLGIAPDAIDRIKKDFVTSINNGQKINPPLYLQPETYTVDELTVLVIQVPVAVRYVGIMAASLIEAMNQILTLQTTLIWYINSMQEKAEVISSIK